MNVFSGTNIPVYRFGIKSNRTLRGLLCSPQEEQSTLDSLLLAQVYTQMETCLIIETLVFVVVIS